MAAAGAGRPPPRCPFTQYRLLHDFGWEESGKNARQALKRTLLNLQEARWEGEVNDSVTGRKTHEDHFGIIDRVLWPVVRTAASSGSATSSSAPGSWSSCATRRGSTSTGTSCGTSPPSPASCSGCSENDRFEPGDDGEEWQAYWLGPAFFASVGSTCARERDNVAALMRACDAIAGHPGTGYRFTKERVATDDGLGPAAAGAPPRRRRRPARPPRPRPRPP